MKKFGSILFLIVFLFNIVGYYGVLLIISRQINRDVVQRIEKKADEIGGSLTFRIPLRLPYPTNSSHEYQKAEGTITYEGEVYRLLKKRFYGDTLYIVCIKDQKTGNIQKAITDYVKTFTDKPLQSKTTKVGNGFIKDYVLTRLAIQPESSAWMQSIPYSPYQNLYSFTNSNLIFHPPLHIV